MDRLLVATMAGHGAAAGRRPRRRNANPSTERGPE
jgi:hypothetical protein